MNKNYIFGIIGMAVGAVIGSVVTNQVLKKQYEQRLAAEIDSIHETYKNYYDTHPTKPTDISEIDAELEKKQNSKPSDHNDSDGDYTSLVDHYTGENDAVDYTSNFDLDKDQERIDTFPEYKEEYIDLPEGDPSRPRVITDEEYYDDEDMTKVEINVFENTETGDYVITDDGWDFLEEPYKVITKSDLEAFLAQHEEDEIFTVCEARHCMYSIMKQGQSWDEFLSHHPVIIERGY